MLIRLADVRNRFEHVRNHVRQGYHQARVIGRHIDNAVDIGRKVYKTIEPMLSQSASGGVAVKQIRRGLEGYEELRDQVLGAHQQAQNIHSKLRSNVPELGL